MKKKCFLIILLAMSAFLLSACVPYFPMEIKVEGLKKDENICVLLKPTPDQICDEISDNSMNGMEIASYNHDGWIAASPWVKEVSTSIPPHDENKYVLNVEYKGAKGDTQIREFCETFKEMRFAVYNNAGEVMSVSDVYSLISEDKFGYPYHITYNVNSGSFTPTKYVSRLYHGHTPKSWLVQIILFSWLADIIIFAIIVFSLGNVKKSFKKSEFFIFIILTLPSAAVVTLTVILKTVPYFNLDTVPDQGSLITELLISCFPYIINLILFITAIFVHRKNREIQSPRHDVTDTEE